MAILRRLDRARYAPTIYLYCSNEEAKNRLILEFSQMKISVRFISLEGVPGKVLVNNGTVSDSKKRQFPAKQLVLSLLPEELGLLGATVRDEAHLVCKIARLIKPEQIDIAYFVHTWYPTPIHPVIASWLAGIPIRISDSQLEATFDIRESSLVQKVLTIMAGRCVTCIKTISRRSAEVVNRRFWVPKAKVRAVSIPEIELGQFFKVKDIDRVLARKKFGIAHSQRIVTVPGRLSPEKGHDVFMDAIEKLGCELPGVVYLFAGDGPLRKKLQEQVISRGLDRIRFLGFQQDMAMVFAASDIVVIPSFFEGGPYVLAEVMAAGRPIISTDVGFVRELMSNDIGRVIPPGDSGSLRLVLKELLSLDDSVLCRMGQAARSKISLMYSEEKLRNQMFQFYSPS